MDTRGPVHSRGVRGRGVPQPSLCPFVVWEASGDVSQLKLKLDILSTAKEAGHCAHQPSARWERTDYQGAALELSDCPMVVSMHHSDRSFRLLVYLHITFLLCRKIYLPPFIWVDF